MEKQKPNNSNTTNRRRFAVEMHKDKKAIEQAIVRGQTLVSVAKEFKINRASLAAYRDKVLYKRMMEVEQEQTQSTHSVVKTTKERQILDSKELFDIILSAVTRMRKLSDACDEYLKDPDDITKYFLGEHEQEIDVVGDRISKDGKRYKVKRPLSVILRQLEGAGYKIEKFKSNSADPRILLVKASETLSRQMDSMVNAWTKIESQRVSFSKSKEWDELTRWLQDFLKKYPEERQALADRLRSL